MPSPFPGMDPFIEGQRWTSFHDRFIVNLGDTLVPQVRPRYVVDVGERVYLENAPEGAPPFLGPDVMVTEPRQVEAAPEGGIAVATAPVIRPTTVPVPMPQREREIYLVLRDRASNQVVTVIEVLSPSNKRPGSDGRKEYLEKRHQVLLSTAHLIELDLLRGGERLPALRPLPPGDYYAFVLRAGRRPLADVYSWSLQDALPRLPIPLTGDDPDVWLDLPAAFAATYERGGYDYSLDYTAAVEPPLDAASADWVHELLAAAGVKPGGAG
jgi:hypothetical protein